MEPADEFFPEDPDLILQHPGKISYIGNGIYIIDLRFWVLFGQIFVCLPE
jgi:hypothetical protein